MMNLILKLMAIILILFVPAIINILDYGLVIIKIEILLTNLTF